MPYTATHSRALKTVTKKGTTVTFTHVTPGTYDASTDTWTDAVDASVSGYAIRTAGDPQKYKALNLVQSESPALLFTPSTYGDKPALGATVSWDSVAYSVRDVEPIEPDGTAIACYVVVSR